MNTINCMFEHCIYHNPQNGFMVISVRTTDEKVPIRARTSYEDPDGYIRFTAVGYHLPQSAQISLVLTGEWEFNKRFGQFQLNVSSCEERVPRTPTGVQAYLSSGLIKGIGEKTAAAIVDKFGTDALSVIETDPERLLEIPGITPNKLREILESYNQHHEMRNLMIALGPYHITPNTVFKIQQFFGSEALQIVKERPYELTRIQGFGFFRVDEIARKTGCAANSPDRIRAALLYCLAAQHEKGHLYLRTDDLQHLALRLLNHTVSAVTEREISDGLCSAILSGKIVTCGETVYLAQDFAMEDETARHIAALIGCSGANLSLAQIIQNTAAELGISLSAKQHEAVEMVFHNNLSMITGSPGTGKTTVLKVLIHAYRKLFQKAQILLAAPTGKASRRMADSTGCSDAKTLHSLLKLGIEAEEGNYRGSGAVIADLLIVDEFTLADMWLASVLFSRVTPGTRILLVGDADQLPSVGAGNVFQEMISSGAVPVTRLHEVFRQAEGSPIIRNAIAIREKRIHLDYGDDFRMAECQTQSEAAELIEETYLKEVAKSGVENVQILTPKREDGDVSAQQLNARIREIVNPSAAGTPEVMIGDRIFRQNDRVIQTKNEKIGDEKISVFNGDIGSIQQIESVPGKETVITIAFSGSRLARYTAKDMRFIQTAYAITIHKFMGSECDTIIVPVLMAHSFFLSRNLIYTAVTRAKRKVILVGQKKALAIAIKTDGNKRNTMLGQRIQQYTEALQAERQLKTG